MFIAPVVLACRSVPAHLMNIIHILDFHGSSVQNHYGFSSQKQFGLFNIMFWSQQQCHFFQCRPACILWSFN